MLHRNYKPEHWRDMLTDEQLAERLKGVTATDAPKIVGLAMYGCAEDVRLSKMGAGAPFVEHDRAKWGHLLEKPIRDDYAERHGMIVASGDDIGTLKHPHEPWAMATPDGLVYSIESWHLGRPLWGHEIKTHISWLKNLYGEPGTDQVPMSELLQCVWNIWVCSEFYGVQIERWDLTVFLDGLPTDYTIMRDVELEEQLIERCREFWQVNVIGGEPCPPDGSSHFSNILSARFPKHEEDKEIEASEAQQILIRDLKEARATGKDWGTEIERITQQIKLEMGDAEILSWPELVNGRESTQRIKWRRGADGQTTAWKAAMMELYEVASGISPVSFTSEDLEQLTAGHTEPKLGSRPFTVPGTWPAK